VYTVTQEDDGTGEAGVGWSEAEAGRYFGRRCGSLRDITTFVFCQQSSRDRRAKIMLLEAARSWAGAAVKSWALRETFIFSQKTGF